MFDKILVANRGEIALRVIRGCKEMGIKTVAIYSEADANSLHTLLADEAICVGPGPNSESYLNIGNVIMAALVTGAQAIHPGYAYFSEKAQFAEACASSKIKFIGPPADAIELMGVKAKAREVVAKAGVPVIPGTDGIVLNEGEAVREAKRIGFPVLVKASAGGGGRGIRRVDEEEELPRALRLAQSEALASFGDGDVYLEKCIVEPRHVEIQILADEHGATLYLGERECSVQNMRHQKIVEEAPAYGMTPELRARMGEAAVKAARAVGYTNAGTVEFLLDKDGEFYFLEMNTRLQVEHPVTEMVTGLDLVKLQIRVAAGEKLPFTQEQVLLNGHAIEARINAVDPENEFAPSAGLISQWIPPGGPGVRVDSYVYSGCVVPPFYDSMIAKLIVFDVDRPAAIARLKRALREFKIEGIKTNLPFLIDLVDNRDYVEGRLSTSLVGRMMLNGKTGN